VRNARKPLFTACQEFKRSCALSDVNAAPVRPEADEQQGLAGLLDRRRLDPLCSQARERIMREVRIGEAIIADGQSEPFSAFQDQPTKSRHPFAPSEL
jgi:hypothetical protein